MRFDPAASTPIFPDGRPTNKSQNIFSEQFGREIKFDPAEDMVFDSDQNERKSLEYHNSKKVLNSAKKLKAPTPQSKYENLEQEEDSMALNKSVEIK